MWIYTLLPQILNMSLTAGIVIVLVLLARIPLKKAPKIFSYALWTVVLFRLVCPVSFSSEFSLLGILDAPTATNGSIAYIPADIIHTEYPRVDLPLPIISDVINENLPQGEEQLVADPLEWQMAALTALWLFGMAAMLIYSTVSLLLLRRRLVGAVRMRDNIYLADHIDTPFVIGVLRPKIYLPSHLSEQEQSYIILHEQTHIRRLDHIFKMIAFVALVVHWFNPLVWAAFICCVKDMEMSCDERVLKEMGGKIKSACGASLLTIATGRRLISGSPLTFGEGNIKDRIKNVMNFKKPAAWVIIVSVVLVAALSIAFAANGIADTSTGANQTETMPLTDEELSYFNGDEFFNGEPINIRNQFMSSLYDAPEKIDLFQLFYCGSGQTENPSDAEKEAVIAQNGWDVVPDCACEKISRASMDAVLTEYMGLTLADTGKVGLENFTYLSDYDAYYYFHGDTNYRGSITFAGGEREGDVIRLLYEDVYFNDGKKVLTLREKDGGYLFVSNVYIETPKEDNTKADQSSPADLFTSSTGNIHDYMPDLLAGKAVSAYDLLPCLENFTHATWFELDEAYGMDWWNPLWVALSEAAVSGRQAVSDDQTLRGYYIGKAYLASDGAYAEGLSDLVMRQWDIDSATYSACLNDRFSAKEVATLRLYMTYSISHDSTGRRSPFGMFIPGSERSIYLGTYPVDFPFGCDLQEITRESYRAESFGQVTVVESDGLQVTYLNPAEGVYNVITVRADKKYYAAAGVTIGDTKEFLLAHWPDKLKKLDRVSYDDEAWFGNDYDLAYAYTPEESTKSILFLVKEGQVSGIEIINGLDGAMY